MDCVNRRLGVLGASSFGVGPLRFLCDVSEHARWDERRLDYHPCEAGYNPELGDKRKECWIYLWRCRGSSQLADE